MIAQDLKKQQASEAIGMRRSDSVVTCEGVLFLQRKVRLVTASDSPNILSQPLYHRWKFLIIPTRFDLLLVKGSRRRQQLNDNEQHLGGDIITWRSIALAASGNSESRPGTASLILDCPR